ncbi:MAG: hypothetical protein HYR85_00395 [Planctomycetes bacterium]|nr:hypothetical protein [Planctomycetota bacterium]
MTQQSNDPGQTRGEEAEPLLPSMSIDDNDPDLVIDDGTVPVSDSADVDTAFDDDEEIVLEEDDTVSVEVVVKIQQDADGKETRRPPVMRPKLAPEPKPLDIPTAAPVAPAPHRFPRWWIAAAASLLFLLGAGLYVFITTGEPEHEQIVGFRPPPMEAVPTKTETTVESEPQPEPVAEEPTPKPMDQVLPAAPAPVAVEAPTPAPVVAHAEPAHVETPKAAAPSNPGEDKNIETSAIGADETIVELKNGNTFAGRLKRFDRKGVTLEIWNGVIALSNDQLRGFLSNDSPEFRPIETLPMGFVELPNRNRIYGRVFKVTDSRIILAVSGARFGFSPAQVKVGYLRPGEEPPPEPGFQPVPEPRPEPPKSTPRPSKDSDGPHADPDGPARDGGDETDIEKEPTRPFPF